MTVLLIIAFCWALTLQTTPAQGQTLSGQSSISGRVYDANHNAIPNAKVTLYYTKFIMDYVAADPVKMQDNPQLTSNGSKSLMGLYVFTGLPPDVYIVTVEKDGIAYTEKVQLREGTKTADLTIPGYIDKNYSASPTATPRPGPTFTSVIPPITGPGPDIDAIIGELVRLSLMALVGLQFIAGIAIIALGSGRKK